MTKSLYWAIAVAVTLIIGIVTPAIIHNAEQNRNIEAVDGLIYTYIVGKVEGNDDLLASILTEEAQGIIKPGRHAFPGAAEDMGERYGIIRYDHDYGEGVLYYRVEFHRPYTGQNDFFNVVVLNTPIGWKIAKNSSIDEYIMKEIVAGQKGEVVHAWEGAK